MTPLSYEFRPKKKNGPIGILIDRQVPKLKKYLAPTDQIPLFGGLDFAEAFRYAQP
jgi:hypothetical protein